MIRQYEELCQQHLFITSELCRLQLTALGREMPNFIMDDHLKYIERLKTDQIYRELFIKRMKVLQIHAELKDWSLSPSMKRELNSLPGVIVDKDWLLVPLLNNGPTIISYGMFLNVLDKIEAQFTTYLTALLYDTHESLSDINYMDLYLKFDYILEEGYRTHGNDFTDLLKSLEGIIVGFILSKLPPATNDTTYGTSMRLEFQKKRPSQIIVWDQLIEVLENVYCKYGDRILPYLYQLYTHEKLHFFPMVTSTLGIAKMKDFGTKITPVNNAIVVKAAGMFVVEYIYGYHAKYKFLPPVQLGTISNAQILEYYVQQKLPTKKAALKLPLEDWAELRFSKHVDFLYHADISDWLDDKSTAPYYDQVFHKYAPDVRKIYGGRGKGEMPTNRMILKLLANENIDVKLYFQIVENLKEIPEAWRTIVLVAKEMERKLYARMFSILTLECRMMASVCEKNLADSILPYFDEQTMTDSGSEVKSKIDLLTTMIPPPHHKWVSLNMDFEQWNYTIRDYAVAPLCNVLNSLFGVEHYHSIQWIFRDGILVSGDPYLPINHPEFLTAYKGHLGGNQGIFQKLWTILTICLIKMTMLSFPYQYKQLGAGDNQILLVCLRDDTTIHDKIITIQQHLEAIFFGAGMKLNQSECWFSDQLFLYQRKGYLKGVPCPLVLKMASRASSGIADVDCGFEAIVSTSTNAGITINEVSPSVLIGYIFALLENQMATSLSYPWTRLKELTETQRVIFYMLPADMGYPSNLPLMNYLYSGHKDTTADVLALLKIIWDMYPSYRSDIASALTMEVGYLDDESRCQLLESPHALNIKSPPSMIALIKRHVEEFLRTSGFVKNQTLRTMFSQDVKSQKLELMKALMTLNPLNTEVCHTLVNESAFGQIESFMSKFNSITSIVKLTGKNRIAEGEESFSNMVMRVDTELISFIIRKLKKPQFYSDDFIQSIAYGFYPQYLDYCSIHSLNPRCTFSLRLYLIIYTYDLPPIQLEGSYVPSAIELLRIPPLMDLALKDQSFFIIPSNKLPRNRALLEVQRGPLRRYLGSRTKDTITHIRLNRTESKSLDISMRSLANVYAWFIESHQPANIINIPKQLLLQRLPKLEPILTAFSAGSMGGCLQHRFSHVSTVMGAYFNGPPMITTHYDISTNTARKLNPVDGDRMIFYQALLLHLYNLLRFCEPVNHQVQVIVDIDCCAPLLNAIPYNSPLDPFPVPHYDLNEVQILDDKYLSDITPFSKSLDLLTLARSSYIPGDDGLVAPLVLRLIQIYHNTRIGRFASSLELSEDTVTTSVFNVTLLRRISLQAFFRMFVAVATVNKTIGNKSSMKRLLMELKSLRLYAKSSFHYAVLKDFLYALVMADRLPDLLTYANCYNSWNGASDLSSLIEVFLIACIKGIDEILYTDVDVFIPITIDLKKTTESMLQQWIKRLNIGPYRPLRDFESQSAECILHHLNSFSSRFHFRFVYTIDHALQVARSWLRQHPLNELITHRSGDTVSYSDLTSGTTNEIMIKTTSTIIYDQQIYQSLLPTISNIVQMTQSYVDLLADGFNWKSTCSRSARKLLDIEQFIHHLVTPPELIITLAEGHGGFLSTLLHLYPSARGIYNSLLPVDNVPLALVGKYYPSLTICQHNIHTRINEHHNFCPNNGDLTNQSTWMFIHQQIITYQYIHRWITLDLPLKAPNRLQILQYLNTYITLWMPDVIIIKTSLMELLPELFITVLSNHVHYAVKFLLKPPNSRLSSLECYLVCCNYSSTIINERCPSVVDYVDQLLKQLSAHPTNRQMETWLKGIQIEESTPWCFNRYQCLIKEMYFNHSMMCSISILEALWQLYEHRESHFVHNDSLMSQLLSMKTAVGFRNQQTVEQYLIGLFSLIYITNSDNEEISKRSPYIVFDPLRTLKLWQYLKHPTSNTDRTFTKDIIQLLSYLSSDVRDVSPDHLLSNVWFLWKMYLISYPPLTHRPLLISLLEDMDSTLKCRTILLYQNPIYEVELLTMLIEFIDHSATQLMLPDYTLLIYRSTLGSLLGYLKLSKKYVITSTNIIQICGVEELKSQTYVGAISQYICCVARYGTQIDIIPRSLLYERSCNNFQFLFFSKH
ncbi:RNA-dependent RNA polymerase [Hubei rhabdo-like virus 8]|uniref:RNA-directed RNA polymerase n=1 Tax=Hubei rhabdo-like virus 8 TaxID=1923192 RepID=A0A1L3KMV9_9MONO|nr:RNA-dependent RNA polymerase [Hubei rhabdo-like virus 8]APG78703.1 RNA-dependent RNA polymerase [Hubei rhabdo-like virus 8]